MFAADRMVPPGLTSSEARCDGAFQRGRRVIYRKQKCSARPGPKATHIHPSENGDSYSYEVAKFWTVLTVLPNNRIIVCTRRGKQLSLTADDPALRRANWLERFLFRRRFPVPGNVDSTTAQESSPVAPISHQITRS
jgi:hypothetical protein